MKKILTICVIAFIALNTILWYSCSRDKDSNKNASVNTNNSANTTKMIVTTATQAVNDVNYPSNTAQIKECNHIFLWISVIVLLVSNLLCVALLIRLFKCFDRESCDSVNNKYNIDKMKEDIEQLLRDSNKKVERQSANVVNNSLSDADMNIIVDRVRECIRLDELEKTNTTSFQNNTPVAFTKTLYASCVGEDMIIKVYEHPTNNTVYSLEILNDNEASFVVYEGAKGRVLNCEDFLNNACNVETDGNFSGGIECIAGTAKKSGENTWIVINKANVKFV